jgi:signal transduction histidine kinase
MSVDWIKKWLGGFWTLQVVGWATYGTLMYVTFLPMLPPGGSKLQLLHVKVVRVLLGFTLTALLRKLYSRFWRRSPSMQGVASIAFLGSVICGCLWLVLSLLYNSMRTEIGLAMLSANAPREALDYTCVMLLWSTSYFGIKYWQDWDNQRQRAFAADNLAQRAQLDLLRYQLNPHFLFNALNSIRASIDEDQSRAKRMVTELSEFLRYSLLTESRPEVPFSEEVKAAKNYLAIEKIRFEERLQISFQVEPDTGDCPVPAFIIQPLVENAIKHGRRKGNSALHIELKSWLADSTLHIQLSNTGAWARSEGDTEMRSANGGGVGLQNVKQRLEKSLPGRHHFGITEDAGWIRVKIELCNN